MPAYYAFRVDYLADDLEEAKDLAMAYAEGLAVLRPEVETRTAQVAPAADRSAEVQVFCNEPSGIPEEACTHEAGHVGDCSWESTTVPARRAPRG